MSYMVTVEAMKTDTEWYNNTIDAEQNISDSEGDGWAVRSINEVLGRIVVVFERER